MTRILTVVNQKGGVGKTTTTVNLATALAAVDKRVLVVDLDPQGNASTGFGIENSRRKPNSYDVILGGIETTLAIQKTTVPQLDIIPSTIDLSGAEIEMVSLIKREYKLKKCFENSVLNYDYLLIDCPPSLGLLTINALVAANAVLIPLQCEFYAMEGLSYLMRTIQLVKANLNPDLGIQGIVLTMYDRRNRLTEQIETEVRNYFGDQVYRSVIPRNVRMSEAPSHGKPALIYDMRCAGSAAYIQLAKELLKRERAREREVSKVSEISEV